MKTEEAVQKILQRDYPLSAGQIRQKCIERFGITYSVSGIQTALRNLRAENLIHKSGPRYSLDLQKVIDQRNQLQRVIDRYTQADKYHLFQKEENHYFFRTLQELDTFWNAVLQKWFAFYPADSDSYIQFQPFPWFALTQLDQEKTILETIASHCKSVETLMLYNNFLKDFTGLYAHQNLKLWTTHDFDSFKGSFGIYHDHVIQFHFPPKFKKAIEDFIFHKRSFDFQSIQPFFEEGNYELIISKDRKLAEKLKKKFRKMKK